MASAEEFAVTPYNFETEYEEGKESSNLSIQMAAMKFSVG